MYNAQRQDWALWFQAQGVESLGRQAAGGPSFDDQTPLIGAALSSQGVALVTEALASPESKRGRLVAVTDATWPQEFAYRLVCPQTTADQPKVTVFRQWLLAESAPSSTTRTGSVTDGPMPRPSATAAPALPASVPPERPAPGKPRAPRAARAGAGCAGSRRSSE